MGEIQAVRGGGCGPFVLAGQDATDDPEPVSAFLGQFSLPGRARCSKRNRVDPRSLARFPAAVPVRQATGWSIHDPVNSFTAAPVISETTFWMSCQHARW